MSNNTTIQSRKYELVISDIGNYKFDNMESYRLSDMEKYGHNLRLLKILIQELKSLCYYCYSFGIKEADGSDTITGKMKTESVLYAYLEFDSPVRYETLDNNLAFDSLTPIMGKREEHTERIKSLCEENGYVTVEFYEHESVQREDE